MPDQLLPTQPFKIPMNGGNTIWGMARIFDYRKVFINADLKHPEC